MPQDWEEWSSVPTLASLKPYKKYLKVLPKPFDFAPRIGGGSEGQLDLKGLVKKNPKIKKKIGNLRRFMSCSQFS